MEIRTHYAISKPLSHKEEKDFKETILIISDKLSIRNPNRREFLEKLKELVK